MILNNVAEEKIKHMNITNTYVVADFDRTITNGNSKTSWSVLASSNLVPKSYIKERQELYDIYRPIEIDDSLPLEYRTKMMKEWYQKHIELFIKYQIKEDIFKQAATDLRVMEFRKGAKEFIEFLCKNNVPLIIISAGIGNFIETFLTLNNCYFDNIYISSNKIIFKDGIATGVDQNIIHSLNKNEVSLPSKILNKLQGRENVILLGDQTSDLNMVNPINHNIVLTVGFVADDTTENITRLTSNFDIVCDELKDYYKLKKKLF